MLERVGLAMSRDLIVRTLRERRPDLELLGVSRVALFGSIARDEATFDSDVDLLVEFQGPVGLFHFVHVKRFLEQLLGRPVDLVTSDALHPALREVILAEAFDVA